MENMRNALTTLLALTTILLFGYACDSGSSSGSSGDIVVENISGVSGASAAKLYYPGNISAPAGATTMSAGYTQTLNNVDWLSRAIAKEGFVVLGLTPSNNWGMVSGWRDMHKGGISKLKQINGNHNVLRGRIDLGKLQTCGHSKGGGGSLWASSQLRGELKTTVGMAPYREQFSSLSSITAATFIQAGSNDSLATNSMTRSEYSSLPGSISRRYAEYSGMGHLAWDRASGSTAAGISGDIIAWMKYYMDGNTSYAGTLSNKSGTTKHEWVDKGTTGSNSGNTGGGTTGDGETISGTYSIVAAHSGKALDVWEWGTTDGTNIVQYDFWGGEVQQFVITPVDGIWHSITPVIAPDQGVEAADGSVDSGANVQTYNYWGHECQQWRFQKAGSGRYRIINRNSELCMDVVDFSTDDGANVMQYTCLEGGENQMFELKKASSSGGNNGSGGGGITGASCTSTGTVYVTETIRVTGGTYDGKCKTFVPIGLGDGSQDEDQKPVFRVENGAALKNVIIGSPGADGIHLYNGATLDNVTWEDVGEDACTVKASGNYNIRNITGYNGSDKFFQINAACTFNVSNAIVHNMGKTLRQNGGTTFKIDASFDRCEIQNMKEGVFRSDSKSSTARITNSRLRDAGDICIGSWASCTHSGITFY